MLWVAKGFFENMKLKKIWLLSEWLKCNQNTKWKIKFNCFSILSYSRMINYWWFTWFQNETILLPLSFHVLLVWWGPHCEWILGHLHSSVGRGVWELSTHVDWSPVIDQWTRAEGQHTGLRKRWLNCQSVGHYNGPVLTNSTR